MNPLKTTITIALCLALVSANCQATHARTFKSPTIKTTAVTGESVVLGLNNLSGKPVTLFTGPKSELSNPESREKSYESLSTNTIYASVNEVVCIVNTKGKTISCADIVSGVSELEISKSGTVIKAKE